MTLTLLAQADGQMRGALEGVPDWLIGVLVIAVILLIIWLIVSVLATGSRVKELLHRMDYLTSLIEAEELDTPPSSETPSAAPRTPQTASHLTSLPPLPPEASEAEFLPYSTPPETPQQRRSSPGGQTWLDTTGGGYG